MASVASLPSAFIQQMESILGDEFSAFTDALATPSPTSIHWNPLKLRT